MTVVEPLSAPIELSFDYTRSLGPTLGRFMTGLAGRALSGARGSDGRVYVPPLEFDPVTGVALTEFVDVADRGEVLSWTWAAEPLPGQPLDRPFAWVLVKLDGADTGLLHVLAVDSPAEVSTGLRVRAKWATDPVGEIRDIRYFVPEDAPEVGPEVGPPDPRDEVPAAAAPAEPVTAEPVTAEPVTMAVSPVSLRVEHCASIQETRYLLALEQGRLVGQRCPACRKVYIPPRGACPVDGVPTEEEVELPDRGIVTTFCIVNVPFYGQRIQPPYVCAYILLDGADIAFLHLILDCPAEEVRMGMRVEAVWKPRAEWVPGLQNITHFRPTGEPDADYETFKEHL